MKISLKNPSNLLERARRLSQADSKKALQKLYGKARAHKIYGVAVRKGRIGAC